MVRRVSKGRRVGERFIELTLTSPDGQETSLFTMASVRAKELASSVLSSLSQHADATDELMLACLAQGNKRHSCKNDCERK